MNAPTRTSSRVVLRAALALGLAALTAPGLTAQSRPPSAHAALNNGIDAYRQGDYETAARYFQQASAAPKDLSPNEREDLNNMAQLNRDALLLRQQGHDQLDQAEKDLRAGRMGDADVKLQNLAVNQFLSPADKQRRQQLGEVLRSNPGPAKGQEQVASKPDGLSLLQAGQAALAAGDLDRAETLADEAEKAGGRWWLRPWNTPSKLRRQVQVARAARQREGPALVQTPAPPAGGDSNTEQARRLVHQGRQALQQHDLVSARRCADQAGGLQPNLHWDEDNPDRLRAEIDAIEKSQSGTIRTSGSTIGPELKAEPPVDPRAVLKQGRDLYAAGKLDEARERALRAAASGTSWGWLEDKPDKLLEDIRKARLKRDQDQAEHELVEARKLFEQHDLEGARAHAFRAERLHGPYTIWSLGDRPAKVLADVEAEEAKRRKPELPPPPPTPPGHASGATSSAKPQAPAFPDATAPAGAYPGR